MGFPVPKVQRAPDTDGLSRRRRREALRNIRKLVTSLVIPLFTPDCWKQGPAITRHGHDPFPPAAT